MKLDSEKEIDVPIATAFEDMTDFPRIERRAAGWGAELRRTDELVGPCVGMTWQARVILRERRRDLTVRLVEHDAPDALLVTAESADIEARIRVALTALSPARSRVAVRLDVSPRTLAGRLLLQSAKLAGKTLEERFRLRVANYAMDIEDRAARQR